MNPGVSTFDHLHLLAEVDPMIGACMELGLRQAGFTVDWTRDGKTALERKQVFERFYRVPGSNVSGCGLGLSIVRQVGLLHGNIVC